MARKRRYDPVGIAISHKPSHMAEALDGWIAKKGLRKRFDMVESVEAWPELVGPQIAAVTLAEAVTPDGTLLVRVTNHAWATELGLMAPRILTRINGNKKGRVKRLRWIVGPIDRR